VKKVLVIMGSPRRGNTMRAAQAIEESMQELGPVVFEYCLLKDADLARCRGCYLCFQKGEEHCPLHDDAPDIERRMHEADGVIFATPVYGMNVSGLFKTFVDRFSYIFHRPRFFDKKALLLTTTGVLGEKEVLDYLEMVARIWGFEVAGRVGLITPPYDLPEEKVRRNERKLDAAARAFHESLHRPRRSPSWQDVMIFHAERATFRELPDLAPVDHEYWEHRGWLDRNVRYFVDVPVNPIYHALGSLIEWYIGRQVRKDIVEIPQKSSQTHE
jgi:multimeric flavodoxin WrbA